MPRVHLSGTPLPPILMFHFLEDFEYHPVGSLSLAISLWIIWYRPPMLDVICLGHVLHILIYERGSIVADKSPGDLESCNDVFSNKVCHNCSSGLFQRDSLYPFCKILSGCQDPYIAIGRRVYGSYKIKPPSVERPWCGHILQHIWMSMDYISKYLACMTCFNQLLKVLYHRRPIVPQLYQLLVESSFPWVTPIVTGMDFPNCFSSFLRPLES